MAEISHKTITIPTEKWEKVERELSEKTNEIANLTIELEKSRTILDQKIFSHEIQLSDMSKALDDSQTEKLEFEIKVEGLEKRIEDLNGQLVASNLKASDLNAKLKKVEEETSSISMNSSFFLESIESRDKLISDLKKRVGDYELQTSELHAFKENALKEIDTYGRTKRQMLHKEQNYQQEKSLLHKEIAYLQSELENRTQEVLRLHKNGSSSMLNFETRMAQMQEREKSLSLEKHEIQKLVDTQTEKVEKLLVSLSESREAELKLEEQFRSELSTQEKINEMRLRSCNELEKRCEDLEKNSEELRGLLQEASKVYGALERAKKHVETEAQIKIDSQNEWIQELQEESAKINKALDALTKKDKEENDDSPATKAVTELLAKGMTLSQLYSEYMTTAEKLYQAEQNNKNLNEFVSRAVQEQKEARPIQEKLKQEHEQSLQMIDFLGEDLKKITDDLELQKKETLDREDKLAACEKKSDRLQQQICDLSKQLTTVLVQVEALKNGSNPFAIESRSPEYITCAKDVIDQKLLTFNDVTELQKKNIKLVASIRELSTHLENTEEALAYSKTRECNEEFELALSELSQLREKNLKLQSSLAKVSSKALNLEQEKSMLNQSTGLESLLNNSCNKNADQSAAELEQLKTTHKECKQLLEEKLETSKAAIREMECQLDKLRVEKLQLLTQAEYNEERIKALSTNCETLQRQLTTQEAKLHAAQGTIGRQDGIVHALEERNQELSRQLSSAQSMMDQLREEKIILKSNTDKLMAQREEFLDSRQSQSMILSHLDIIRRTVDKNSVDMKSHLEMQVYELSRTCAQLQAKVESKSHSIESSASIAALQESLEKSREEISLLKKELENHKSTGVKEVSVSSSFTSRKYSNTDQGETVSSSSEELESELAETKARVDYLLVKISGLEENLSKLKDLCDYQEQQLSKANEAHISAKEQLDALQKEGSELKEENCLLTDKLNATNVDNETWKGEMQKKLQEMVEEQEQKIFELSEANKTRESAEEARNLALEDLQTQSSLASESQSKYETEVKLHSADLQTLNVLRERLQQTISENTELKTFKEKLEIENSAMQAQSTKKEAELKSSADEIGKRATELEEQNQTLLTQFTELSAKMCSLQTDPPTQEEESEGSPVSSSTQLQEMINFLRKEKEIHLCRLDASQMENQRLQTQKKNLESQMEMLQKTLLTQQQKCQELADANNVSSAITRKVETIDALSDSNNLLREEKVLLQTSVDQLTAKVDQLEKDISPFQSTIRDLNTRIDTLVVEKKSASDEKEMYRTRCQELVEKLNKANPDELAKLRKDLRSANQDLDIKSTELTLIRAQAANLQKTQQTILNNKNQLQIQLNAAREELKNVVDESKKFSQEKIRIQQQAVAHMEKSRTLEVSQSQTLSNHRAELQSINAQVCELLKKEEASRSLTDSIRKENETKEKKILELSAKNETLERQAVQLRRIALKYKEKAGSSAQYTEGAEEDADANEKVKELEEKVKLLSQQLEATKSIEPTPAPEQTIPVIQAPPETETAHPEPEAVETQEDPTTEGIVEIEPIEKIQMATEEPAIPEESEVDIEPSYESTVTPPAQDYQEEYSEALAEITSMENVEIVQPDLPLEIEVPDFAEPEQISQPNDSRKRKCLDEEMSEENKKPRVEQVETMMVEGILSANSSSFSLAGLGNQEAVSIEASVPVHVEVFDSLSAQELAPESVPEEVLDVPQFEVVTSSDQEETVHDTSIEEVAIPEEESEIEPSG